MVACRTLYELTAEYDRVFEAALAVGDDGELTPDFVHELHSLEDAIDGKLANCCRVLKNLQALQESLDAEAKRLRDRSKTIEANLVSLKGYVIANMETLGVLKTTAGPFRLSICKNSVDTVEVLDLDAVPHEFDKVFDREVSLTAVRDATKAGRAVPGVSVFRGSHLRVG